MNYKICVIGDYGDLLPYRMAGLDVFVPKDQKDAEYLLDRLVQKKYGIIYIMENWAERIASAIHIYDRDLSPAIIPLLGSSGSKGLGNKQLQAMVEQAIGINILQTGE